MAIELAEKKATVVGLGIEGIALVQYLVKEGAKVTGSDVKSKKALSQNLRQIQGLPVRLTLGGNRVEDTVKADIVFVSQGVPLDIPCLVEARMKGIPISSMTQLFLERCPAPVVGITGSAGKSTTTALLGEIFRAADRETFVGGNIGVPLLGQLPEITPMSWVVLEISHTQLELTRLSPHVAAVTNISPSHMDRYPTMEEYIELKERIFRYQNGDDYTILNLDDTTTVAMARHCPGQVSFFSRRWEPEGDGTFMRDGWVMARFGDVEQGLLPLSKVNLMGEHNLENVLAACAVAAVCQIPGEAIARGVEGFRGIEHRLEWVRSLNGVDYYNDSIATTPERTVAGLRVFQRPVVLIAGGKGKNLPMEKLAKEVNQRCKAVVLYGEAGLLLEDVLKGYPQRAPQVVRVGLFAEAVAVARSLAKPGDVVLLSPASTSFDQFANFEERGREFKRLVNLLVE